VTDAVQVSGIIFSRSMVMQRYHLIAKDSRSVIDGSRVEATKPAVLFRPGHEESTGQVQAVEAGVVQVGAVHQVESPRLEGQLLEHGGFVNAGIGNGYNSWDVAAEIEQGMEFHSRFLLFEGSPREKR